MFETIKSLFKPRERKVYVLKVTPELLKKVEPLLKKELGMKDAIIAQQKETIEKLTKEIQKLKGKETEEEKIAKDLFKEKQKIEKMKAGKRILLKFSEPLPKVVTYDNKYYHDSTEAFKFLYGLELEETEKGFGWNLIVKSEKNMGRVELKMPLEMLFVEPQFLVSQLKAGVVRTRIDSKGRYISPLELQSNPTHETYKKLSELKKEYEDKIADLEEELSKVYNELKDTRKREEQLKRKLKDFEQASEVSSFTADMASSALKSALEKVKGMMRDYLVLLLSSQDSEVNRVLTERLNSTLVDAFKEMREKLGVRISQEEEEYLKEKLREDFLKNLDVFHELSPRKVERVTEVKPEAKPEEKKGG